ncbi:MAG: hypothetical protein V1679_03030 [Candidatus Peregrinibacteria bacterium]
MILYPPLLLLAIAAIMIVIFLPALAFPGKFQKAMKNIVKSEEHVRVISLFWFILSFMMLSVYWKLTKEWFTIFSILGWLLLLKAVVWLWFPEFVHKTVKKIVLKSDTHTVLIAVIEIVIAVFLVYIALNQLSLPDFAI